ncbi:hypothetical protein DPMN_145118 [Dreissena polymorpha]|uniref:Uncharacterized protein n=1 Tax=Dreissena polymorpha TaxID=45954 RepID=A0A9D4IYI0_DREPO|nr:hypothetical protein DPMN_145118 [Dreissena polymorpha]
MALFARLMSTQSRMSPSFFGIMTTGDTQFDGPLTGSITSESSNSLILASNFSRN